MTQKLAVEPAELVGLARSSLGSATSISESYRTLQNQLAISSSAFGNTGTAPRFAAALLATTDKLGLVVERLIEVYDSDADNLFQAAAAYHHSDEQAARRLRRQGSSATGRSAPTAGRTAR